MKTINVINVMFAEKTGIQDLYETIEECKATGRDISNICYLYDDGCVGVVISEEGGFIEVYEDFDEYEILD